MTLCFFFFLRTFAAYIFSWEIKNCLKPLLLWCQGCDSQEHRERDGKDCFSQLITHVLPFHPLHDIGGNTSPPESFALCPCLQLAQSKAHFLGICLEASWPGVFWPLSLVIPCQGLSCDAGYSVCTQSILAFFFRFLAFVENFLQRQMLLLSGNDIWRILLRQLLIIVCTLLSTVFVILNISAPYKSTHLMLEFRRWISLFLSLWQK